jgi:hypothetical protein
MNRIFFELLTDHISVLQALVEHDYKSVRRDFEEPRYKIGLAGAQGHGHAAGSLPH